MNNGMQIPTLARFLQQGSLSPKPDILEMLKGFRHRQEGGTANDPSFHELIRRQAEMYGRVPDGPIGTMPEGRTPTYGDGTFGQPGFGNGQVLPPRDRLDQSVPGVDMWVPNPTLPDMTRFFR